MQVVLATHNPHKVAELAAIAADHGLDLDIVGYHGPEPVEDGVSFEQNALIKARAAVRHTGCVSVADDSGICVDVLGGAPGIFSAYWAGHGGDATANLNLLLDQLADIRDPHRGARFVATLAVVVPDGSERVVRGEWAGRIARTVAGDRGFGYDPIFIPDGQSAAHERTAAQYRTDEKNRFSHRAQAFRALMPVLTEL